MTLPCSIVTIILILRYSISIVMLEFNIGKPTFFL